MCRRADLACLSGERARLTETKASSVVCERVRFLLSIPHSVFVEVRQSGNENEETRRRWFVDASHVQQAPIHRVRSPIASRRVLRVVGALSL